MLATPPWNPPAPVYESSVRAEPASADLRSASLGQDATELRLTVKLRARPRPGDVCLELEGAELCLGAGPVLLRGDRPVDGRVAVDGGTLTAAFTPAAVDLPLGRFRWSVRTSADRIPATGSISSRAVAFAAPKCFGAAARDPWKPCQNPALRTVVTPTPYEAQLTPNAPCTPTRQAALVSPCLFGLEGGKPVGLVGDSHAEHWRAALEVVAQARRRQGISLTLASCPFNASRVQLPTPSMTRRCARWNREVRRWIVRHRDVDTVFVSENAATVFAGDPIAGYRTAWRSLPPHVRRIYVLRDTPRIVRPQADCVRRLMRSKRPIGFKCAQPRALNLPPDPAALAARSGADRRVRLLDLSAQMCSSRLCPAVIGGVLVRKDGDHLTRAFSATLGPFVLRAIRRDEALVVS